MSFEVTATRKRPQNFDSLAGQEFVVTTLKNAIAQGRIAHAYLFAGPRGVGKTSCARLLAKALNCTNGPTAQPCGECENCKGITKGNSIDVIEIDGASNTGVNDVRVIKEEVMFPPTSSRYKIYIIDEVHMLSQSAFNALLKTIEEPPEYVVFIFATTETQKVPATIRSRCQQFNFRLLNSETIQKLLRQAAQDIDTIAEENALFWIAKESTGSMRDAYTLFDQIASFSDGNITMAKIREKLGLIGTDRINGIVSSILADRLKEALDNIQDLLLSGVSIDQTIKDFSEYFRSLLLIKQGITSKSILGCNPEDFPHEIITAYTATQVEKALDMFLNLYRNIRYSLNPKFELELAVTKLSRLKYIADNATVLEQLARLKNDLISGAITPLNKDLKDIPTIKPATPSVSPFRQNIQSENNKDDKTQTDGYTKTELSTAEEKPVNPIPENKTEELKMPDVQETPQQNNQAEAQKAALLYSEEQLKAVLPQGVGKVENTEHGLVLLFGSNFFYQAALGNRDRICNSIKEVVGQDVNVVISFSEQLANQRKQAFREAEEIKKKTLAESMHNVVELDASERHIFNDFMSMFKGHEEK